MKKLSKICHLSISNGKPTHRALAKVASLIVCWAIHLQAQPTSLLTVQGTKVSSSTEALISMAVRFQNRRQCQETIKPKSKSPSPDGQGLFHSGESLSIDHLYEARVLVDFFRANHLQQFTFLDVSDFRQLQSLLKNNPRLPNQFAIELKTLEQDGVVPINHRELVMALQGLASMTRSDHHDICRFSSCGGRQEIVSHCVSGVCEPRLIERPVLGPQGGIQNQLAFELEIHMTLWGHSIRLWEQYDLEVDSGSRAIRTQNPSGEAYLNSLLAMARASSQSGHPWIYSLIDLNNLGLVNHFWAGHVAGDAYIEAFAASIQKSLSSGDYFFRIGGDEFLILSSSRTKDDYQSWMGSIIDEFYHSEEANQILEENWQKIEEAANEIDEVRDVYELLRSPHYHIIKAEWNREIRSLLRQKRERPINKNWIKKLKKAFVQFKQNYHSSYKDDLLYHNRLQKFLVKPTFSVGAVMIRAQDTILTLKHRSSTKLDLAKKGYKEQQGANAVRLGGNDTDVPLIEQNIAEGKVILPQVLRPD